MILKAGLRHFSRHPIQLFLCFFGIMLGVALSVAVDLANTSAIRNFEDAAAVLGGKSTFRILPNAGNTFSDSSYVALRRSGITGISPVLEHKITHPKLGEFTFFGIDPFADREFRSFSQLSGGVSSLGDWFSASRIFFCEKTFADSMKWSPGDFVELEPNQPKWKLAGVFLTETEFEKQLLRHFLVTDIQVIQEAFHLNGQLSRIDVLDEKTRQQILKTQPELNIRSVSDFVESKKTMTSAFRLNLGALSKLGLLVSVLLVFQASGFSVIQRKLLFSRLYVMGVSRKSIAGFVLLEALVLGIFASAAGLFLGVFAASKMLPLVGATMTQFFDAPESGGFSPDIQTIVFAFLAGIFATISGAVYPSFQAGQLSVREGNDQLQSNQKAPLFRFLFGLILVAVSAFVLVKTELPLVWIYGFILLGLTGFMLLLPFFWQKIANALSGSSTFSPDAKTMAFRSVVLQPRGVLAAVISITLALGMYFGVSVMVKSFRNTVTVWLGDVLKADLYVSANNFSLSGERAVLNDSLRTQFVNIPGVEGVGFVSNTAAKVVGNPVALQIVTLAPGRFAGQTMKSALDNWKEKYRSEGFILISEPLALKQKWNPGDEVTFSVSNRDFSAKVAGIYYDYASVKGAISMNSTTADALRIPNFPDGASIFLGKSANKEAVFDELKAITAINPQIGVQSNSGLLDQSIAIFDQTFLITDFLRWIIGFVAALGVAGALSSRVLEKDRTFGLMKALGFSNFQRTQLVMVEALTIGLVGVLLAIPVGLGFAWVLVEVINTVSFGWSLTWKIQFSDFYTVAALGLGASFFAGFIPAYQLNRNRVSQQLREE